MFRGVAYLAAAGAIWLAEGFMFGSFFKFSPPETVAMAAIYVLLFALTCRSFVLLARRHSSAGENGPAWRYVSLAPQIAVIVGSFVSLPVLILILAAGRVL